MAKKIAVNQKKFSKFAVWGFILSLPLEAIIYIVAYKIFFHYPLPLIPSWPISIYITMFLIFIFSILAITFSSLAIHIINKGHMRGKSLAITGLILGIFKLLSIPTTFSIIKLFVAITRLPSG